MPEADGLEPGALDRLDWPEGDVGPLVARLDRLEPGVFDEPG